MSNTTIEEVVGAPIVKGLYYYYTFNQGHAVTSWRIERLTYNLDDPKQLLDFILQCERRYPNFYLTWWKKLGEPT